MMFKVIFSRNRFYVCNSSKDAEKLLLPSGIEPGRNSNCGETTLQQSLDLRKPTFTYKLYLSFSYITSFTRIQGKAKQTNKTNKKTQPRMGEEGSLIYKIKIPTFC